MNTALSPCLWQQFLDDNGDPVAGGYLYTYHAGTDTPKDTYTSYEGTSKHENPIELDGGGFVPDGLWLERGGYKFILQDSNHNVLKTIDNVIASGASGQHGNLMCVDSIRELRALEAGAADAVYMTGYYQRYDSGYGLFLWNADSTEDDDSGICIKPDSNPDTGRWYRQFNGDIDVYWFGAKGDGVTDDTGAIELACDYAAANGRNVLFTKGTYYASLAVSVPVKLCEGAILTWQNNNPTLRVIIDEADATTHFNCSFDDHPKLICQYVRPEWFYGEHALRIAIESCAASTPCVQIESPYVKLSAKEYLIANETTNRRITKDNVRIIGCAIPEINTDTAISADGISVIKGTLDISGDNVMIANCAIDVGTECCDIWYSSTGQRGISIESTGDTLNDINISNVAVLCMKQDQYVTGQKEAIYIRDAQNVVLDTIATYYGHNGIKIMAKDARISNIKCKSAIYSGILIENSDNNDERGESRNIVITNVDITGISKDDTKAIILRNDRSMSWNLSNISMSAIAARDCYSVFHLIPSTICSYICNVNIGAVSKNNCYWPVSVQDATNGLFDWDTILLSLNTMTGDVINWVACNTSQFHVNGELALAGVDGYAIDILDVDENTGIWKSKHNNLSYKSIGQITSVKGDDDKYRSQLDIELGNVTSKSITSDEIISESITSQGFNYVKDSRTTECGIAQFIDVGKSGSISNGLAVSLYSGSTPITSFSILASQCYVIPYATSVALNVYLYLEVLSNYNKMILAFVGNKSYMNPSTQLTTEAACFQGMLNFNDSSYWGPDFAVVKIIKAVSDTYFQCTMSNNTYFTLSKCKLAFNAAYPVKYE